MRPPGTAVGRVSNSDVCECGPDGRRTTERDRIGAVKIVFACFSSLDDLTLSLLHAQPAAARPAIPWAKAELFWVEPAPGSLLRFPTERIAHDNRCTAGFRCDLMSALGPEAEKLTTSKRLAVCTRKRIGEAPA